MTAGNHSKSEIPGFWIFGHVTKVQKNLENFFLAFQALLRFLGNPRIKINDQTAGVPGFFEQ